MAFAALFLFAAAGATGSFAQRAPAGKVTLTLATDRLSYAPGGRLRLAAVAEIEPGWHIQSHQPALEYLIPTELEVTLPPAFAPPDVTYPADRLWQAEFEAEPLRVYDGRVIFHAAAAVPADYPAGAASIEATLRYQACDDRICLPPTRVEARVATTIGERGAESYPELFAPPDPTAPAGAGPSGGAQGARGDSPQPLGMMIALALLGGLVLNVMPCVLPVLSLKLLGLLRSAEHGRRFVALSALASASGILFSFVLLAAFAIGLRAAGRAAGWGVQLQNPRFVVFLLVVVVLFSLNLWGLFEVPLPRFLGALAHGRRAGLGGHFTAGVFATLLATPCSAPFLGPAVGFALSRSAPHTLGMFLAIGVGMALPYFALALVPQSITWLPKPGAWMVTLRGVLGFLLAATAVWLLYVLRSQLTSERLALVEGAVVLMALGAWLVTQTARRAGWWRAATLVAAIGAIWLAQPGSVSAGGGTAERTGGRIAWQRFDRARLEQLAWAGQPVFVDVTADWCATCKVIERVVLETDATAALFAKHAVVAMKADWTNGDPEVTRFLADHGRYGVPFFLLYRGAGPPHVFGEVVTARSLRRSLAPNPAPRVAARP